MKKILLISLLTWAGLSFSVTIPPSGIHYPGASDTEPFTAIPPYVINIQGVNKTIDLGSYSRGFNFSGPKPFVNPATGVTDASSIQAWDPIFANSFNPPLEDDYILYGDNFTNAGFPGRVDKRTVQGQETTMVRYNAGDGTTWGTPRSKLNSFPVPPRTHVKWRLNVAFGNPDGYNDWVLTPTTQWINGEIKPGSCPVLFWQLRSNNATNPALSANVDTDNLDPSRLMITFSQRTGTATKSTDIGVKHGLLRHTFIVIDIEAFLDERSGGKGALKIWVDGSLVVDKLGETLKTGIYEHAWSIDSYLWSYEGVSSPYTRAAFFRAAKFYVYP